MNQKDRLAAARGNAYSMENMAAHEAEGREVRYIGSRLEGNRIYDYYEDDAGQYWFKNRMYTPDNIAVSEEEYVLGKYRTRKQA